MISLQNRFLFVHIPKTAGNSIQSVLRHYSEDELVVLRQEQDGVERFGLRNPKFKLRKHSTLAEYRAALGEEAFGALFKFTCVRNPWDRMVSLYFQPTQKPEMWDPKKFRKLVLKTPSIADYLRLDQPNDDPFGNVRQLLRFENLADDFRSVCAALDIPAAPLPIYNRSARKPYAEYYDVDLRDMVGERFAPEIERFGYKFD